MNPAQPAPWKGRLLLALSVFALLATALLPALPQDPAYHRFADTRTLFGIVNFWNVVTNLPFLLVGGLGLREMRGQGAGGIPSPLWPAYGIFFAGIALIAPGSAFYHLAPNNFNLVWDRLPMALAFMAFFAIVTGERVSVSWGSRLLWPLVLAGVLSVLYWYFTERAGEGDLRPYALTQFLPMVLIPAILLLYPDRSGRNQYVWSLLGLYGLAKLAEALDGTLFQVLPSIGGHALKHLISAAAPYCIVMMIRDTRSH